MGSRFGTVGGIGSAFGGVNTDSVGAKTYADVVTDSNAAVTDILAEGPMAFDAWMAGASTSSGNLYSGLPGFFTTRTDGAAYRSLLVPRLDFVDENTLNALDIMRGAPMDGFELAIKGRYIARADTAIDALFYQMAIGIHDHAYTFREGSAITGVGTIGHTTETTRDDYGGVIAVVDSSENIQSYNNDTAGDASLTDSTIDTDLSAGMAFEMIWDNPGAGAGVEASKLTLTMTDAAGDAQTILDAVSPSAGLDRLAPVIMMNQNALLENLYYRVRPSQL